MCRWLTSPPLSISSIVVSLWLAGCLAKSTLIGWREYYGGVCLKTHSSLPVGTCVWFPFWALKQLCKKHEDERVISIQNNNKCLSQLFQLHLNTYVMGLRPLYMFYSSSAGIDFKRQNMTSIDVRFWRLKTVPALKGLNRTIWSWHKLRNGERKFQIDRRCEREI